MLDKTVISDLVRKYEIDSVRVTLGFVDYKSKLLREQGYLSIAEAERRALILLEHDLVAYQKMNKGTR